mgnify:CR=1 FL=1
MSKLIYLDNAATTQVYPEVLDAMLPYFTEHYGNPAAIYSFAGESERAVAKARKQIADVIGAKTEEIYFTGGGSESDNWALKATAEAYSSKGKHIITSAIEHHAILHTAQWLELHGFEVTYVGVDENGKIKLDELEAAIRPDTILISVMAANNEIGTIRIHFVIHHWQRSQDQRTKGNRSHVYPQRRKDPFFHSRRCTGTSAPCRHTQCPGYRRNRESSGTCSCQYGKEHGV